MRRAAAKGDPSAAGQAAAAADRLREAQRQLQRNQTARGERDVKDAQRQAADIAQEQADIANDARQLPQSGPDRVQKAQMLGQRKDALEGKVADLEKNLDRMVGEQTRESRDTGRKLSEAASGIRDNKIKEKNPLLEEPGWARARRAIQRATTRWRRLCSNHRSAVEVDR
jgi:hypothetical protein